MTCTRTRNRAQDDNISVGGFRLALEGVELGPAAEPTEDEECGWERRRHDDAQEAEDEVRCLYDLAELQGAPSGDGQTEVTNAKA